MNEFDLESQPTEKGNSHMKIFSTYVICGVMAASLTAAPVQASDDDEKALAALALLGLAAMAHNDNHYHEGYKPANDQAMAKFERGYRDGLHNEPYDSRHSSFDYGQGYDAGHKERANRLAHKRRDANRAVVPHRAKVACRDEVASSWGVDRQNVHLVNTGQEGASNYYIEFASGHKHVICGANAQGEVFSLRNGRM